MGIMQRKEAIVTDCCGGILGGTEPDVITV
jgi:hypothetical protein